MNRLTIAPIVEGQGEEGSIRNLLYRIWTEMLGGEHVEVLTANRRKRGKLLQSAGDDLKRALDLAVLKLRDSARFQATEGLLILVLVDAEEDCQKFGGLGPMLLTRAREARSDADIAVVIANIMFETWFVATADGQAMREVLELAGRAIPDDPDAAGLGKGWIKSHMQSGKYSPIVDQPRLTARMDLALCRRRSRSFDKLCRELEKRRQA